MAACEVYLKLLPRCRMISSFLRTPYGMRTTIYSLHTSSYNLKRRKTAEEKKAPRIIEYSPKPKAAPVAIWRNMTVKDLAEAMNKDLDHVFEAFIYVNNAEHYGSPDAVIDNLKVIQETLKKCGMRYQLVAPPSRNQDDNETRNKDVLRRPPADASKLVPRPPVVTVMGHVDHGKTTLLDTLRNARVVDSEFGGITQHIGAFSVVLPGKTESITFLDTPGHAAFTSMRARGADATDIVLLVVAADDGVMEQTVESIRMAHEAEVPIIVAINKIDKPEADIARTKDMLLRQGLQLEESGGDIQSVPISALKGTNMPQLIEAIALQAELMELKAEPTGFVEGLIIESKKDAQRGKLSTTLVQRGTLRRGCVLVSGLAWVKVRAMFDDAGRPLHEAPPSTPVEILGWRDLPMAGDDILEVESEREANEVVKFREALMQQKKQENEKDIILAKAEEHRKVYRAQLEAKRKMGRFRMRRTGPREKEIKDDDTGPSLNIVLKGDVGGSLEAIMDVLECYDAHEQCKLSLVHYGVGNVSENDIDLAGAFNGLVYAFNVDAPKNIKQVARSKNVNIKPHNVLYKMIDDIKEEISQRLPPKQVEDIIGEANVLQFFEVTEGKKKVSIAGSRCTKGVLKKGAKARVLRNGEALYEGSVVMLRHLKDEVSSIKKDVECGIKLDDISFDFKPGDIVQCFSVRDESQKCDWDPGF